MSVLPFIILVECGKMSTKEGKEAIMDTIIDDNFYKCIVGVYIIFSPLAFCIFLIFRFNRQIRNKVFGSPKEPEQEVKQEPEDPEDPEDKEKEAILLVLPFIIGPPLHLSKDFITFLSQVPSLEIIALTESVPYTRLVRWVKRAVSTNLKLKILYIASHGTPEGIAFSDGLIGIKRIATLAKLSKVDLVILMSCDGFNLATALRQHGVKAVVYIDGKIEDEAAIQLMKSLVSGLSDGLSLEESMDFIKAESSNELAYSKLRITTARNYTFNLEVEDDG